MYIWWGPDLLCFYNDAYCRTLGPERHPGSLGRPGREVWAEIWHLIGHQVDFVMAGGGSTWDENRPVPITRFGRLDEIYWTYSYSPIDDETSPGGIGGVLVVCTETTQAVLAERRRAAESERLSRMFEQAPGFMAMLVGPSHVFELTNAAYMQLTGHREVVGKPVREALPEIEGQGFFELLDTVYATGEPFVGRAMQVELQRTPGASVERRFVDLVYQPITDADGAVTGIFVEGSDVTEQVLAETELRDSEARYRTLFEAIDAGFCIVEIKFDGDGRAIDYRFVEVNPAFEQQTGLYGAVGKWVTDAAPGLERHWFDIYGRVALTGEAARFENRAEPLGRWYDVHAFRVGEPEERRVAILFNDISARKAAEDRLGELNETLERQVEERTADRDRMWRLSTDVMLVARFDGTVASVNPAWTTLLGWSEAELVGRSFMDLVHPDDLSATLAEMGKLGEGVTTFRFENRYRAKDGEYRWLSWTAVPAAEHIHAVGRDITTEKARAAALESAQEALRQSQKMEAMGQLTGGVAHDFNNLLTPIVGGLDMLQRRNVGGEREQRLISGALQSADRAKTLVQRLLAFARRQPLQATAVDISALVRGMADLVASTSGPQIRVVVEAPETLPPAMADPNQLEMALLNLGVNARDAMPDGGTLRITARLGKVRPGDRAQLKPGEYVCLSVADTGVGMDAATLAKAIEPFFSTKGVGKGTGLGLSMAHGLASQLGGALTIESRVGVGTNVELWLPISVEPARVSDEAGALKSMGTTKGTALLVDDEELARVSTTDMLSDLGYAVIEAASAEEALRLLGGGARPDLLITDHLMPGMSGTDLIRLVQAADPQIQVLLISGYAETEGVDSDLPRLTKPFRSVELVESLASLNRVAST